MNQFFNHIVQRLPEYPQQFIQLFLDMGLFLLIGMAFSGLFHILLSKELVAKHLGKPGIGSIIKASLLGVPLPLCSCGVIPTAIGFSKSGASKAAVTSFLISTPQTGIDNIIATAGLMGPFFAIYRPITAFLTGIVGGIFVDIFDKKKKSCCNKTNQENNGNSKNENQTENELNKESCCCHSNSSPKIACEDSAKESSSCCCSSNKKKGGTSKFLNNLMEFFNFGFLTFTQDLVFHLLIGIAVAAAISTFIDKDFIQSIGITQGLPAMLIMLVIGLPMYICSNSAIPLAVAFIAIGFSPASVFVFLLAGPVTNITAIGALVKALGKKCITIYLLSVSIMAILFGYVFELLLHFFKWDVTSKIIATCHSCHKTQPLYKYIAGWIFAALLVRAIIVRMLQAKKQKKHSCCG